MVNSKKPELIIIAGPNGFGYVFVSVTSIVTNIYLIYSSGTLRTITDTRTGTGQWTKCQCMTSIIN